MKFQAKFLQPKSATGSQTTLMHVPDVYLSPNGRIEGEDPDLTEALDHSQKLTSTGAKVDDTL